ncbi:group II intron maturase-specific domain-containing protein [Nonomuraea candida]|uniref:group II intron maturase-specific domain-containing protein n=1 Tax=Nonomuraea candida TaxID=359159 RepID=UPI003F6DD55B
MGWMRYYGAFYRTALHPLLARINNYLMRWSRSKYKRLKVWKTAIQAWERAVKLRPEFFAHWIWVDHPRPR